MNQPTINFPAIDHWRNDLATFSSATNAEETRSGLRPPSDPEPRSTSPEWPNSSTEMGLFQTDNLLAGPPAFLMPRKVATQPRQPMSYLPETVNTAWQAYAQPVHALDRPTFPPKRFYFEASPCCSAPRIRLIHECCNKETRPREIFDERPPIPRRTFQPVSSKLTLCRFCLKNGEPPSVYYSHNLHVDDGRVACPILRRYDCPVCKNGGGDFAHTVRYCPALRANYARG